MKAKKVKLGDLFEVNKRLYAITEPKAATEQTNEHGQIVHALIPIE